MNTRLLTTALAALALSADASSRVEEPKKGIYLKLPMTKKQKKARAASMKARKARRVTRKYAK